MSAEQGGRSATLSPVTPLIINHWVAGGTALSILLLLLLALLVFGAGREHS